ncbi:MAG: transposase family protein [Methylocella sp.]
MTISFLEQIKEIPDHRIAGMVTYPLDEILLATLVGVVCGAGDFEAVELLTREYLAWLKKFLPCKAGIPQAQTLRKVFRLLKPEALERCFASWVASLQEIVRGVVAVVLRLRSG